MKLMTGGWVCEIPAEVEFIEVTGGEEGVRPTITFIDADGNQLAPPDFHIVPEPEPWFKRKVTA